MSSAPLEGRGKKQVWAEEVKMPCSAMTDFTDPIRGALKLEWPFRAILRWDRMGGLGSVLKFISHCVWVAPEAALLR